MAIQAQLHAENYGFSLCGSQDLVMDNGCTGGFSTPSYFNLQLFQQQQHFQQKHYRQLNSMQQQFLQNHKFYESTGFLHNSNHNNFNHSSIVFSESFLDQAEKQRQEIDQYLRFQNERLRMILQEERKQQLAGFLEKLESKVLILLKQKDNEIQQAAKRTMELEEFLRKIETENLIQQKIAIENEAMVISLNNTLEHMREKLSSSFNINEADDAGSCCDHMNTVQDRDEAEEEQGIHNKIACRGCNSQISSILFLPCRHLCSCKSCESVLHCCPVCNMVKKDSIEVLIF